MIRQNFRGGIDERTLKRPDWNGKLIWQSGKQEVHHQHLALLNITYHGSVLLSVFGMSPPSRRSSG